MNFKQCETKAVKTFSSAHINVQDGKKGLDDINISECFPLDQSDCMSPIVCGYDFKFFTNWWAFCVKLFVVKRWNFLRSVTTD